MTSKVLKSKKVQMYTAVAVVLLIAVVLLYPKHKVKVVTPAIKSKTNAVNTTPLLQNGEPAINYDNPKDYK